MTDTAGTDTDEGVRTEAQVTIRRAPKYPVFLALGGVVGLIGTAILTASFPVDRSIGFAAMFGYFCVYGVPFGVALGGFLALILDRRATRRARAATAERVNVELPPEPEEPDVAPVAEPLEYEAVPVESAQSDVQRAQPDVESAQSEQK
jgi:hypothetical protein